MENDLKNSAASDRAGLGSDNADILAAKRRRNAAAQSSASQAAVNAAQLRAQMQKSAQSARPTAQPTKSVQSARPAAQPVKSAQSVRPAAQPTKSVQSARHTAQPTRSAQSARPAVQPTRSAQNARPEAQPIKSTQSARPAAQPTRSASSSLPSLIPYQQASAAQRKPQAADEATRITDVRAVRAVSKSDGATRLTDVSSLRTTKIPPKEEDMQDESEGSNTVISIIKAITYIIAVVVVAVFLSVFVILVGNDVYAFVKDDTVVDVSVDEYATLDDIATMLHESGIIQYPSVFKLYANLKSDNGEFLAGDYSLSPMMNYDELLASFKPKKASGVSRITIPEGYTTDDIIDLLVSRGIGTREGYVDVINNYDFDYWFIDELEENGLPTGRIYRLDGYLFPDTYEFYNASSEEVVIGKLLKRFNEVFIEAYKTRAETLGYTVDEVLTLASMIEKEAGTQSDFFDISSVFHNRLKNSANFPYLESDATVVYAIQHDTGERIQPTGKDLEYVTPYNTYLNQGLPPGPIANPSASAIRAALYPSDTKYYFFVSASSRLTYFSTTREEHEKNIAKIVEGDTAPETEE